MGDRVLSRLIKQRRRKRKQKRTAGRKLADRLRQYCEQYRSWPTWGANTPSVQVQANV